MVSEERTSAGDGRVPPSRAIIEAIADAEGVDVTDVEPPAHEPLYVAVDPEALDSLFEKATDLQVAFAYEGYDVVVREDGRVDLSRIAADGSLDGPIEE